ncbi:hypothetical protein AAE02nite_35390 [Adhaeribacter aerolatus]|uniref:General stress protein 17M-like domain-containing protein n=2 Tax=Adhaeribacter aerolatus TaxID=670289 RepID=A0A512B1N7_9BACT|nr:hypothetical protein AAE02nite_35390 [Adhaeribacter aerolatus]
MENNTGANSGRNFEDQNNANNNNMNNNSGSGSSLNNLSGSSRAGQDYDSTLNSGSSMTGSSMSGSGSLMSGRTGSSRLMTGMFRDRDSAERAYSSLSSRGYTKDDINLVMSDETRKRHFGDNTADSDLGDKALEGAGAGSAIGGTLGAIVGAVAAIGTSVAIPGLGLVVAGPLAAGLAGAGAGGLTGGLLGALVGSGIPEDRAKEYEHGVKEGGIVMGVHPRNDDDATYLENEWRNSNGESIYR